MTYRTALDSRAVSPLPRLRGRAGKGVRAPACPHPSLPPRSGGRGYSFWPRLTFALLLLALAPTALHAQTGAGARGLDALLGIERPQASRLPGTDTDLLGIERPQASRAPDSVPAITVDSMSLASGSGSPRARSGGSASQPPARPASAAGNPIDVSSGNKYQEETDLPPLPGVLGLELKRHYNSRLRYQGLTGYGWSMSYEAVLQSDARRILILQADGRGILFLRDPANPNQCASPNPEDGRLEIKDRGYEWHWRSGRVLVFRKWNERAGSLEAIREKSGETISFAYGSKGELVSITDPQGRQLSFHYLAGARAQLVDRISTPAGEFRYRYDGELNLIEVKAPDGTSRRYHYETDRTGGDPHNLTGITDERGIRIGIWSYDSADRAISSELANGAERITLAYQPGLTVLTNSEGASSEYRYAEIAGALRLTETRGPGCRTCPEPNMRYTYTASGQLVSATRLGRDGEPIRNTLSGDDKQEQAATAKEQAPNQAPGTPAPQGKAK